MRNSRTLALIVILFASLTLPMLATDAQSIPSFNQQSVVGVPHTALVLATATLGNANVRVWVNTNSGVYHCPGTRWYGNTKVGEYMTQKQAQEKGNRPAYGKVCQ
jgi:hypothetical protein